VALTDTQAKALKPKDKAYSVADGQGLVIDVRPTGLKVWRYRYRFNDKPAILTIGEYPIIGLADARAKRDEARKLLINGVDPRAPKQEAKAAAKESQAIAEKAAYTFEQAFNDWFDFKIDSWSKSYADDVMGRFKMYLLPTLGKSSLIAITPTDCLDALKKVEATGKLGALEKVKTVLNQVMRYSVSMGKMSSNPARDLDNSIFKKAEKKNFAHQTNPDAIREIFRKLWQPYRGYEVTHDAAKLVSLTFLRANEVASLKFDFIDWDNKLIRLPAESMKMSREHLVPLSRQALAILENRKTNNLHNIWVFPAPQKLSKPINDESLRKVLRIQGITQNEHTTHGWRHAASTILNELGFERLAIESQLSHILGGVAGVYSKAQYLEERIKMMQVWADWLEEKTENAPTLTPVNPKEG
jgi:integrase